MTQREKIHLYLKIVAHGYHCPEHSRPSLYGEYWHALGYNYYSSSGEGWHDAVDSAVRKLTNIIDELRPSEGEGGHSNEY